VGALPARVGTEKTRGEFSERPTGFFIPTGRTEPAGPGTGLPVQFGRKPVEIIGQIRISNQNAQFKRFPPVYRPVPGRLTKKPN
jgi:hypothetical protein